MMVPLLAPAASTARQRIGQPRSMEKLQMKRSAIIAATCALTIGVAQAASNGTLGTTSTGTQNISATVPDPGANRVRVSGLTDVILGTLTPGRFTSTFTSYCFFHTSPT